MSSQGGSSRVVALVAVLVAVGSLAESSQASDIALRFSTQAPATGTAMTLHIHYTKTGDPNAKPSPIRKVQIDAPTGTVFHSSTVPSCQASDAEATLLGPNACPSASRIGGGPIVVITGFGPPFDPLVSPTPTFNDGRGWLEISQTSDPGITVAVTRGTVTGNRISETVAAAPGGPPDNQSAVSTVDFSFPESTGYITTPPTCPQDGTWVTTGTFTFADGTTQTAHGETPCAAAASATPPATAPAGRPAAPIRVRLRPATVRAARRARIRVALTSTDAHCVSDALVRGQGRHSVRTDRAGRATITQTFHRAGPRTLIASKHGCASGRATLMIRPAD